MADYLTRLVERSIAASPAVKPVIPPLFGTGPHIASLALNEENTAPHGEIAANSDRQPAVTGAVFPNRQAVPPSNQSPWGSTVPDMTAGPDPYTHSLFAPESKSEGTVSRNRQEPQELIPARPNISTNKARNSERERPEQPSVAGNESIPALGRPMVHAQPLTKTNTPRSAPPVVVPAAGSTTQDNLRERASLSSLPPVESSTAPIRITIGRVEVRAIFPAAPWASSTAPRRKHPPLSLDEYLRQRNGGRR